MFGFLFYTDAEKAKKMMLCAVCCVAEDEVLKTGDHTVGVTELGRREVEKVRERERERVETKEVCFC